MNDRSSKTTDGLTQIEIDERSNLPPELLKQLSKPKPVNKETTIRRVTLSVPEMKALRWLLRATDNGQNRSIRYYVATATAS